jgi:hypothetical protein
MLTPFQARRFARTCVRVLLGLAMSAGLLSRAIGQPDSERLLTDAEIAGLERLNALWRQVRPADEVDRNLQRLRAAGFSAEELAAIKPRLVAMWEVSFERNFGWLHEDTVERIREIDRQFITRMRATRLYENTGVRVDGQPPVRPDTLDRLWRSAILRALDHDEIAEFRLMNSALARDEMRRAEGLTLTDDERRTLFVWRREFEGRRSGVMVPGINPPAWQQQDLVDEWRRLRDLLGDGRFVTYLARAQPDFDRMREALVRAGENRPTPALELWSLRQSYDLMRNDRDPVVRNGNELKAEFRAKVQSLLGGDLLARYLGEENARWLVPAPVRRGNVPGVGAGISSQRPRNGTFTVPPKDAP